MEYGEEWGSIKNLGQFVGVWMVRKLGSLERWVKYGRNMKRVWKEEWRNVLRCGKVLGEVRGGVRSGVEKCVGVCGEMW